MLLRFRLPLLYRFAVYWPQLISIRGKSVTEFLAITQQSAQGLTPHSPSRAQDAAKKLESVFLSEMLKSAGLGEQENSFSGGPGEAQFASFQRDLLADAIVEKGGIGLAEMFFRAMMEQSDDT